MPRAEVLVFSFFKAFLDLAEAMLVIEMGITCGRFDGDCASQKAKSAVLNAFRSADGPRVLLATIHSGGVGLNITIANHVIFADRWPNPQIAEQAICRAHRIGQTKPVQVTFIDAAGTFDEAVKATCEAKLRNSELVLADTLAVGSQKPESMKQTVGVLNSEMKAIVSIRAGRADYNLYSARARDGSGGASSDGSGGGGGGGVGGGGGGAVAERRVGSSRGDSKPAVKAEVGVGKAVDYGKAKMQSGSVGGGGGTKRSASRNTLTSIIHQAVPCDGPVGAGAGPSSAIDLDESDDPEAIESPAKRQSPPSSAQSRHEPMPQHVNSEAGADGGSGGDAAAEQKRLAEVRAARLRRFEQGA